jgi:hypothetical protein
MNSVQQCERQCVAAVRAAVCGSARVVVCVYCLCLIIKLNLMF